MKRVIHAVTAALLLGGASYFVASSAAASGPTDTTWQWGSNTYDSGSSSSPTLVKGLSGVVHLDSSNAEDIVVLSNGTVEDWGVDGEGDLGNGTDNVPSSSPVLVKRVNDVTTTASGFDYVLALTSSGRVWAWGFDGQGNLCNGKTNTYYSHPFLIPGVTGVKGVAAGGGTTVLLLENGTLETCGSDQFGQLGDGVTGENSSTPVAVSNLTGVTAVSGANDYEAALTSSGKVYGWGNNSWGQLGNGYTVNSDVPVQALGITDATQIYAGGDKPDNGQMMVEEANHGVVAYGNGVDGQLCDGKFSSSDIPTPVKIPQGVTFEAVASGGMFSMLLDSTGGVWTCGSDKSGVLGNPTAGGNTDLPTKVDSGANMISTTGNHALDHHA